MGTHSERRRATNGRNSRSDTGDMASCNPHRRKPGCVVVQPNAAQPRHDALQARRHFNYRMFRNVRYRFLCGRPIGEYRRVLRRLRTRTMTSKLSVSSLNCSASAMRMLSTCWLCRCEGSLTINARECVPSSMNALPTVAHLAERTLMGTARGSRLVGSTNDYAESAWAAVEFAGCGTDE